jgi:hypothetical protein
MPFIRILILGFCLVIAAASLTGAQDNSSATSATGLDRLVTPISNEVSYYKNMDDLGDSRGTTLQIISINMFHVGTDFIFEFTGDFNWEMDLYEDHDYYIELSLVKPVYRSLSVNYQRIYSTFADEPINQFGLRLSLFSGS